MMQPLSFKISGKFDWGSLPGFIDRLHAISTAEVDRFELDLQNLGFCEPVALTCLAAGVHYLLLREQECVGVLRPLNPDVSNYLERLGLFQMLGEKEVYPFQKHSSGGRFVELKRLTSREEVASATTAVCEVFGRKFGLADKARNAVDTILSEITENVFHHAQSPTGAYLCCQSYDDRLSAAIVDLGDGIRNRLSDTPELERKIEEHGGPLQAAIAPRVTTRPAHNSGYGLALTSELVRQNAGSLRIRSQWDCLVQKGSQIEESVEVQRWPGTVIYLTVERQGRLDVNAVYDNVWPMDDDSDLDFLGV